MKLAIGVLFLLAAMGGFIAVRPRGGKPRWFVNTMFEVPIVITLIAALAVGGVLIVEGSSDLR
jgi:hypothetical protein